MFDWILEKRSPLTRNLALKKLAVLKLFAKLLYRYTTYISTYFLNMKVMNIVKNIKLWKVKKKSIKNMHTLFKDILIICFRSLCLISVLRLILTNDSRVDML